MSPTLRSIILLIASLLQTIGAAFMAAQSVDSMKTPVFWGSVILSVSGTLTAFITRSPSDTMGAVVDPPRLTSLNLNEPK